MLVTLLPPLESPPAVRLTGLLPEPMVTPEPLTVVPPAVTPSLKAAEVSPVNSFASLTFSV